jgi:hypothetical protein
LKEGSVGDPDIYLGAKLRKVTLENGVEAWSMSPSKYVQEAVKNVKKYLQEKKPGRPWLKIAPTPFAKDYRPEIDISPELGAEDATYYMSQIGVLCWLVELGRVDIITEVSMLASQLACPRDGHLEAVYRIFAAVEATMRLCSIPGPAEDLESSLSSTAKRQSDRILTIYQYS